MTFESGEARENQATEKLGWGWESENVETKTKFGREEDVKGPQTKELSLWPPRLWSGQKEK